MSSTLENIYRNGNKEQLRQKSFTTEFGFVSYLYLLALRNLVPFKSCPFQGIGRIGSIELCGSWVTGLLTFTFRTKLKRKANQIERKVATFILLSLHFFRSRFIFFIIFFFRSHRLHLILCSHLPSSSSSFQSLIPIFSCVCLLSILFAFKPNFLIFLFLETCLLFTSSSLLASSLSPPHPHHHLMSSVSFSSSCIYLLPSRSVCFLSIL